MPWSFRMSNGAPIGSIPRWQRHNGSYDQYDRTSSIVDTHCVFEPDLLADGSRKPGQCPKTECASCNSKTARSYNMVRHEKLWIDTGALNALHFRSVRADGKYEQFIEGAPHHAPLTLDMVRTQLDWHLPPTQIELSEALRRVKPDLSSFLPTVEVIETLAELTKLKNLLSLFKGSKHLVPADNWLAFHFGYMPLVNIISDIFEILLGLDQVIDKWNDFAKSDSVMDFHAMFNSDEFDSSWSVEEPSNSYHTNVRSYVASYTKSGRVSVYIVPHHIPPEKRALVIIRALGLDKPLSGAWELFPFSWFVDYFLNVGEMVGQFEEGLHSMFQFTVKDCGYSVKLNCNAKGSYVVYNKEPRYELARQPVASTLEYEHYERTPLATDVFETAILPIDWGWQEGPSGQQMTYILSIEYLLTRGRGGKR